MALEHRPDREGTSAPAPVTSAPAAPPAVTVERVTHQDVPAICGLYKKVWDGEKAALPPELVKRWQPTPLEFTSWMEGVTYFAARRDGRIVGVIGLELRHGSGRLVNLVVDPDHRRLGVASALLAAELDFAKRAGVATVWAVTLARFHGAAALFRRLDFAECGLLHKHDTGEDVRLFERLL